MLDKIYFRDGHLTKLSYFVLENDGLENDEKKLFLTHISNCDRCMANYLESLTEETMQEPSETLPSRIVTAVIGNQEPKKTAKIMVMQFAKLGIAVCLTMTIFFSGLLGFSMGTPQERMQSNGTNITHKRQELRKEQAARSNFFDDISLSINKHFSGFADQFSVSFDKPKDTDSKSAAANKAANDTANKKAGTNAKKQKK